LSEEHCRTGTAREQSFSDQILEFGRCERRGLSRRDQLGGSQARRLADHSLALTHLPQDGANTLFRHAGQFLFSALLALQALHCRQKPQCFWLAK